MRFCRFVITRMQPTLEITPLSDCREESAWMNVVDTEAGALKMGTVPFLPKSMR
jgi:hypothetical protein